MLGGIRIAQPCALSQLAHTSLTVIERTQQAQARRVPHRAQQFGYSLDILVISAAYLPELTPLSQIDPKQFNTAIMTNIVATQALLAAFDPLLRKAEAPLELQRVLMIARQVALGLYYLHCCKPPVLHLDLKSANVLLDKHGIAKVCDFGLAHLKLGADVRTERMGSPMWTSPEVLKGDARNEKADTYSYGMLLFELLTRQLPYGGYAAAQLR